MGKWFGTIGYTWTEEVRPGVHKEISTERQYYGDLIQGIRRYETADQLNDNLNISNKFSIIADPFALENFQFMRYIRFMGADWKITSVEIQHPRLILTVGGIYNGANKT